jgi:hypothetical protein
LGGINFAKHKFRKCNKQHKMTEVYDISQWNIKEWVTTTGTREKCFVENPDDGKLYFFKESIEKFPSEFWSEIIASKIGKLLGFNILDYNIGIYKNKVGCISESIIDSDNEELIHGVNILKKEIPDFVITDRPIISFHEIEKALQRYRGFIFPFIDILIFDCIIGNQDRHSENWAVIRSLDSTNLKQNKSRLIRYMVDMYKKYIMPVRNAPFKKFYQNSIDELSLFDYKFSPIYDSGSSLGREKPESEIAPFVSDKNTIQRYIEKGLSEIKWEGNKNTRHFELLRLVRSKYKEYVKNRITTILLKYTEEGIISIVNNIDGGLSQKNAQNKLSLERKQMLISLVIQRIEFLRKINSED